MYLPRGKKLQLVRRLGKGVSASQICRPAGICRASLYRWKNHYENSPDVKKRSVLSSQYVRGQKHWKKLSVKKEQQIRKIALRNPALSVAKIAVLAGVSLSGAWSVLKNKDLHKREGRERYHGRYGDRLIIPLTSAQRVEMFRRFETGETVRDLCKQFDISRTTFYKWLNLYRGGQKSEETLIDHRPSGDNHYKFVPGVEQLVLALVAHDPGLSPIQISKILKEYGQQHLASQFGVYTILKRYGLNTYQKRARYADGLAAPGQVPVVTQQWKLPAILRNIFTSFIPPPSRSYLISRFLFLVVLFSISFFFAFLSIASVQRTLQTLPLANIVGLSFALISLLFGTLFFLYSLKYYLTIGIVLSFSRRQAADSSLYDAKRRSFLERWFGISFEIEGRESLDGNETRIDDRLGSSDNSTLPNNVNRYGPASPAQRGEYPNRTTLNVSAGGLTPDISSVVLQRHPFVSIHVTTYNEKKVIDRLLTSCTAFDYDNYEVVVVDDSTDETVELLSKWSAFGETGENSPRPPYGPLRREASETGHPQVRVIHRSSREGYKGGALRVALEHTDPRAEFILVFDADFLPYPDTITSFLKYFQLTAGTLDFSSSSPSRQGNMNYEVRSMNQENGEDGEEKTHTSSFIPHTSRSNIAAVQGYQWPSSAEATAGKHVQSGSNIAAIQGYQWHVLNKSENWITRGVRSEYAGSYVIERSGAEIYSGLKQIAGSVYMIRKDALLSVGGWDTSITEDFQLTLKLYEQGFKVVYTPYIQAPAEAVATIKRLVRQRMRWAEGHSHNIKRMFTRLLFGRWYTVPQTFSQGENIQYPISNIQWEKQ